MERYFEKSKKLGNVCYEIRGALAAEADRMHRRGEDVLRLNIGNPAPFGFRASEELHRTMELGLENSEGYSDSKGLTAAREAIVAYCRQKGIENVDIDDVYTGNGASELITMSMNALLNNGDEVLVPAPDYPLWTASVALAGGRAVHYICDESAGWMPDIEDIRKKISPRTKGIVVINPNNPTGALYPRQVLSDIADVARENSLIVFADEIYDRLVMEGEHTAFASIAPDILCVSFNGLSKSHLISGYRCGWMCLCGDKSRAGGYIEGLELLSSMRLCSNVPGQSVIPQALKDDRQIREMVGEGGRIRRQRDTVYSLLSDIPGVSCVKPVAAFYIFPKLDTKRFGIEDDEAFAMELLREKKILVTHGRGFNWPCPDHFRIVYLPEEDKLRRAVDGIAEFLSVYRQG